MNDPLEDLVSRALRDAPLRQAPPSLESRVLAEIARRAALPWWRQSFARWPRRARIAFGGTCGSIVAALLAWTWTLTPGGVLAAAGAWSAAAGSAGGALSLPWARSALTLVDVVRELEAALGRVVPPDWLYGAMAGAAVLYAALFGLGAMAYRTLYLPSSSAGESRT
jgi:hypothetical protein